jgi:23S rRNA (guanosine2251-2'-O)-methyltransferase
VELPVRPTIRPGRELIFGRNSVAEALRGRRKLHALMIAEGVTMDDRMRQIEASARERDIPVDRVPRPLLDDLIMGNHQGIALETDPYPYADLEEILDGEGTVLVLDHLQDPQNLGTLLRAAEAAGICGVIIAERRAAAITPAVVNSSAGAVELLRISMVSNLANALKALSGRGWWIAALDTGDDALDIQTADIPLPVALIVGAEGDGVGPLLRKSADLVLSLPMNGRVESLNAATAGSIAIYEILRRERLSASI